MYRAATEVWIEYKSISGPSFRQGKQITHTHNHYRKKATKILFFKFWAGGSSHKGNYRRSDSRTYKGLGSRTLPAISYSCHRKDVPRLGPWWSQNVPGQGRVDRTFAVLSRWSRTDRPRRQYWNWNGSSRTRACGQQRRQICKDGVGYTRFFGE